MTDPLATNVSARSLNGQAITLLHDVNGWLGALERGPTVYAKPGGIEREWDARAEALANLYEARRLLDREIDALGGTR